MSLTMTHLNSIWLYTYKAWVEDKNEGQVRLKKLFFFLNTFKLHNLYISWLLIKFKLKK